MIKTIKVNIKIIGNIVFVRLKIFNFLKLKKKKKICGKIENSFRRG